MFFFRAFLLLFALALAAYTLQVSLVHGMGLVPVFMGDLAAMTWSGQFNLDFLGYWLLAALWLFWRGGFTLKGAVPALLALALGGLFLAPYLLYLSFRLKGDVPALLLGDRRKASKE